jgi:hypothetical protein
MCPLLLPLFSDSVTPAAGFTVPYFVTDRLKLCKSWSIEIGIDLLEELQVSLTASGYCAPLD